MGSGGGCNHELSPSAQSLSLCAHTNWTKSGKRVASIDNDATKKFPGCIDGFQDEIPGWVDLLEIQGMIDDFSNNILVILA